MFPFEEDCFQVNWQDTEGLSCQTQPNMVTVSDKKKEEKDFK